MCGPLEPIRVPLFEARRELADPQPVPAVWPHPVDVAIRWCGDGVGWQVDVYEPGAVNWWESEPIQVRSRGTGRLGRYYGMEHPACNGLDKSLNYCGRLRCELLTVTGPGGVRQQWHLGGSSAASILGVSEGTESWDAATSACLRHDSRN